MQDLFEELNKKKMASKIVYKVEEAYGGFLTEDYQEAYDGYCRAVHSKVLDGDGESGRFSCITPEGGHTLFCFDGEGFHQFVPCKGCKYFAECQENGNPYDEE